MAEGGTKPNYTLDTHVLECPICLEQLRRPKSLPCLHTFCQECLGTYITKYLSGKMASATSFPCPVCRKLTQPVKEAEDKGNWAQHFPTNSLIQELIQGETDEPCCCRPCEKTGNLKNPATVWCKTCKVLFCDLCKINLHDSVHDGCETVGVSGKEWLGHRQESTDIRCGKHSEEMKYYCEDHQVFGCTMCITVDHRRCDVVTTAKEYCDTLKGTCKWDEWMGSLEKASKYMESLLKEVGEEIKSRTEQQDASVRSIAERREREEMRLNAMEKELTDELVSAIKTDNQNLETSVQKGERLMSSIRNTLESSGTVTRKNDSMETILLYHRGQAELESCKDLVTEMRKSFTTLNIQHVVDPNNKTLDKDAPLSLGKIVIQRQQPKRVTDGSGYLATPLSERLVKKVGKFSIKCPSDTSNCLACGVVYLPSDYIVVADHNNTKLKLFTAEGKYLDEMKLAGNPDDMCLVDTTTVAVAIFIPHAVHLVKISSSKLSPLSIRKMPGTAPCYGVTYTDTGELIVSSGRDVWRVTRDDKFENLCQFSAHCFHLAYDKITGHIFASQWSSQSGNVAIVRLSGQTCCNIMNVGVVSETVGVDVDIEGNVYVCGRKSNNVVQMAGDGTNVRELLTSSDDVDMPRAISVCGDKFVVTNESSGQCNEVRVYQLH